MYVVSSCKGRDLTLQGGVIYVTIVLQSSFFCLETKERSKEKFKADFFLLLAPCTALKGRNSLRSNSLPFLTLRYRGSLDGEKSRPEEHAGWALCVGGVRCRYGCCERSYVVRVYSGDVQRERCREAVRGVVGCWARIWDSYVSWLVSWLV